MFCDAGKKIVAGILCANMLFWGIPLTVFANETSNITNGNWTQEGSHRVYNIEAEKFSGNTGFRHYDDFKLIQGDIANLLFKKGDREYSNFVNLVKNQVVLNGILNTMKNDAFFNGHAIFVSPNGVVIGASGVLNVGALSLITPSQNTYNSFYQKYQADDLGTYIPGSESYNNLIKDSAGNIVVMAKLYQEVMLIRSGRAHV